VLGEEPDLTRVRRPELQPQSGDVHGPWAGCRGRPAPAPVAIEPEIGIAPRFGNGSLVESAVLAETSRDDAMTVKARLDLAWASNSAYVMTSIAGTGVARSLVFGTGGTPRWYINPGGAFLASVDNTSDIGSAADWRPRTVFVSASVVTPLLDTPLLRPVGNAIEQLVGGLLGQALTLRLLAIELLLFGPLPCQGLLARALLLLTPFTLALLALLFRLVLALLLLPGSLFLVFRLASDAFLACALLGFPAPRVALSWLLDDSSMREAMGQAARRRAVAEFTYDTLAHQLVRAIEEAVHRQ
jgi:hypothetical protein